MIQIHFSTMKRAMMTLAAAFMACFLIMGCGAIPALAKNDPGWGDGNYQAKTGGYSNSESAGQGNGEESGSSADSENGGSQEGGEEDSDDKDNGNDRSGSGDTYAEQGFTTPGNGDLCDQIKNSNGKDFFTVRTKNNNTFYLVIDHANSTENVYMLSLIDEDDLAEFLKDSKDKTKTTTAPVLIPEPKTTTQTAEEPETDEPVSQPAAQGNTLLIILLVAAAGGTAYYFMVYKPRKEEDEEETDEGLEGMGDGLPMEQE